MGYGTTFYDVNDFAFFGGHSIGRMGMIASISGVEMTSSFLPSLVPIYSILCSSAELYLFADTSV